MDDSTVFIFVLMIISLLYFASSKRIRILIVAFAGAGFFAMICLYLFVYDHKQPVSVVADRNIESIPTMRSCLVGEVVIFKDGSFTCVSASEVK